MGHNQNNRNLTTTPNLNNLWTAHKNLDCLTNHRKATDDREIDLQVDCFSYHREEDIYVGKFGRQCDRWHDVESFDFE